MKSLGLDMPRCEGILYIGIEIPDLPVDALENIKKDFIHLDKFDITALESAVSATKSSCIGICLIQDVIDIKTALKLSRIEEDKQIEEYGMVEGSHDLDLAYTEHILAAAKNLVFLKLI
jgi:ATP synthase mitochondrial F1 complex assembly factor 2